MRNETPQRDPKVQQPIYCTFGLKSTPGPRNQLDSTNIRSPVYSSVWVDHYTYLWFVLTPFFEGDVASCFLASFGSYWPHRVTHPPPTRFSTHYWPKIWTPFHLYFPMSPQPFQKRKHLIQRGVRPCPGMKNEPVTRQSIWSGIFTGVPIFCCTLIVKNHVT